MSNEAKYLKPQAPLMRGSDYVLPVTTADQIILESGQRLEQNGKIIADIAKNGVPDGGTAGQVLTKVSDANQDAEWKDLPVGIEMKLLWENASPTSSFSSVTLNDQNGLNTDGYDCILIIYIVEGVNAIFTVSEIGAMRGGIDFTPVYVNRATEKRYQRNTNWKSDGSVYFADGYFGTDVLNVVMIPQKIYGIKGVSL